MPIRIPSVVRRGAALWNGQGAQGTVYEVQGEPDFLIKLYNSEPSPEQRARLESIIAAVTPVLLDHAAWPLQLVRLDGRTGIVMPRVVNPRPIFQVYDEDDRRKYFPNLHWGLLIAVAQELAQACAAVHDARFIVADISENNVLVRQPSMQVVLIDADSFVPRDAGLNSISALGTALWLPPELVGGTDSTPRTPDHDNFSLARMVFMLLFQGSDPLMAPHGQSSDATAERLFAFSKARPIRASLPNELTLDEVTSEIADLFELAFAPRSLALGPRPTARNWAEALQRMAQRLKQCDHVVTHWHLADRRCPWCILATLGHDPFVPPPGAIAPPVVGLPEWLRRNRVRLGGAIAASVALLLWWGHTPPPAPPVPTTVFPVKPPMPSPRPPQPGITLAPPVPAPPQPPVIPAPVAPQYQPLLPQPSNPAPSVGVAPAVPGQSTQTAPQSAAVEGGLTLIAPVRSLVMIDNHPLTLSGIASPPSDIVAASSQAIRETAAELAIKLKDSGTTARCVPERGLEYFCELDPHNGRPGVDLAQVLISAGLALPGVAPSQSAQQAYKCAEVYARRNRLGIWSLPAADNLPVPSSTGCYP